VCRCANPPLVARRAGSRAAPGSPPAAQRRSLGGRTGGLVLQSPHHPLNLHNSGVRNRYRMQSVHDLRVGGRCALDLSACNAPRVLIEFE